MTRSGNADINRSNRDLVSTATRPSQACCRYGKVSARLCLSASCHISGNFCTYDIEATDDVLRNIKKHCFRFCLISDKTASKYLGRAGNVN